MTKIVNRVKPLHAARSGQLPDLGSSETADRGALGRAVLVLTHPALSLGEPVREHGAMICQRPTPRRRRKAIRVGDRASPSRAYADLGVVSMTSKRAAAQACGGLGARCTPINPL
jgi:hypothetical protein